MCPVVPLVVPSWYGCVVKRSVSFDAGVWDDLEREVGSGPVSPLVNDALYLRRQRGLAAVAAYEAENGEFTDAELAEADGFLDAAGVVDLRTVDAPAKPRRRTSAKKAAGPRRRRG
jgi:hypothetical protein